MVPELDNNAAALLATLTSLQHLVSTGCLFFQQLHCCHHSKEQRESKRQFSSRAALVQITPGAAGSQRVSALCLVCGEQDACCMMVLVFMPSNLTCYCPDPMERTAAGPSQLSSSNTFILLTPALPSHLPCPVVGCDLPCLPSYRRACCCVSPGGAQQCCWWSWCSGSVQGPHSPHLPRPHTLPHRAPHEQAAGPPHGCSRGANAVHTGGPLLLTASRCRGHWALR